MRKIVIANFHMVDGDNNYRPGDLITDGQIMQYLDHYESLGQVTVTRLDTELVDDPEPVQLVGDPEPVQPVLDPEPVTEPIQTFEPEPVEPKSKSRKKG